MIERVQTNSAGAWLFTRTETDTCATISMEKLITPLGDGRKMDEHEQRCARTNSCSNFVRPKSTLINYICMRIRVRVRPEYGSI